MSDKKPSPETIKPENNPTDEANKLNRQTKEIGGQEGPDPTRYGDWEKGGRCTDF
ncbi:MAG TPA: DUF1674 domain-containing protein [Alphaproteobacteria bacterium]|nr:DUF1674 domain-containing protein [Alphaproteobacteria bacterium]